MTTARMPVAHRPGLPPIPRAIAALPVDARGYPVPWFVQWFDDKGKPSEPGKGTPDFRVVDGYKHVAAAKHGLCWICGEPLGKLLAFVVGPMCAINRTSGEPPAHRDCAIFAAQACPFMTLPKAHRREVVRPEVAEQLSISPSGLRRNPGVALVWITESFRRFEGSAGENLYRMGPPRGVLWYAEGREATRAEIVESIETGLPILRQIAADEGIEATIELTKLTRKVYDELVPA